MSPPRIPKLSTPLSTKPIPIPKKNSQSADSNITLKLFSSIPSSISAYYPKSLPCSGSAKSDTSMSSASSTHSGESENESSMEIDDQNDYDYDIERYHPSPRSKNTTLFGLSESDKNTDSLFLSLDDLPLEGDRNTDKLASYKTDSLDISPSPITPHAPIRTIGFDYNKIELSGNKGATSESTSLQSKNAESPFTRFLSLFDTEIVVSRVLSFLTHNERLTLFRPINTRAQEHYKNHYSSMEELRTRILANLEPLLDEVDPIEPHEKDYLIRWVLIYLSEYHMTPVDYPKGVKPTSKLAFTFPADKLESLRAIIKANSPSIFYEDKYIEPSSFFDHPFPLPFFQVHFYLGNYRNYSEQKRLNYLRCALYFGDLGWTKNLLSIPEYFDAETLLFFADRFILLIQEKFDMVNDFINYYHENKVWVQKSLLQQKKFSQIASESHLKKDSIQAIRIAYGLKICAHLQTPTKIYNQIYYAGAALALTILRGIELSKENCDLSDCVNIINKIEKIIVPLFLKRLPELSKKWEESSTYVPPQLPEHMTLWGNSLRKTLNNALSNK